MALKILSGFSLNFPNPIHSPPLSPLPPPSLRFLLRPFKTPKSLPSSTPADATSSSSNPIFLPHLELHNREDEEEESVEEKGEEEGLEDVEEEEELDPIRSFFKSRSSSIPDPKREGRTSLQRNRRTSWHVADIDPVETDLSDPEDEEEQAIELETGMVSDPSPGDGVLGEILRIARNLPENSTLGDFLGSYAGKIGQGECIELLGKMGEEGLVWGCLYLFEWMGLQEPSLLTPRACSVLFPILGRARMGDKLMVIFENLLREKQFRDVHMYNSAISGLSCCGR